MERRIEVAHNIGTGEERVVESRKQAVSIRMSSADVQKVKKLSQRLGARDSDVIRFAVKNMLARLGPLYDPEVRGKNLIPVFVESGADMVRFFELDAARLDSIINDGAEPGRRVDRDDIVLMGLMGAQMPYAALLLKELNRSDGAATEGTDLPSTLRQYLYDKYVYRTNPEARTTLEGPRVTYKGVTRNDGV